MTAPPRLSNRPFGAKFTPALTYTTSVANRARPDSRRRRRGIAFPITDSSHWSPRGVPDRRLSGCRLLLETAASDQSTAVASGMGVSKAPGELLDAVLSPPPPT